MHLKSYLKLYKKKECRRPTVIGWFILLIFIVFIFSFLGHNAYSFLAITNPVVSKIIVIEGLIPDYAIDSAKVIIAKNKDSLIFTSRVPMIQGSYLCEYKNYAELTAASFISVGNDSSSIIIVPCNPKQKDRTYEIALALNRRFQMMNLTEEYFNILTSATHARRTRLFFQLVFGKKWKIGIISIIATNYDTKKWRTSSFGLRAVIYEGIALMYAKFFFYTKNTDDNANRN
ncbi:MAG: hypothetical protein ACOYLE_00355 [Bacteroidales bacterium]